MIRTLLLLMLFIGMGLIMHGIYEEKLSRLQKQTRIEYRFIPRTYLEEQLANAETNPLAIKYQNLFESEDPIIRS